MIVPQEYFILNDDSLLQEDIPKTISDPLPPIQPIASQSLGDCEKSYYYGIAKKGYSNNEIIFIISHLISTITERNIKENKRTNQEPLNKPKMTVLNQKASLLPKKYKNINNFWTF